MMRVWISPSSSSAARIAAHAPVHHVGRRDYVDPRLRPAPPACRVEHRQRFVVRHVALADHAVMAVIGIGIERHVADQYRYRGTRASTGAPPGTSNCPD